MARLKLDANEGPPPPRAWLAAALAEAPVHLYPDYAPLTRALAEIHGMDVERVLVTAGGDAAIEFAMRLARGLHAPRPLFGMFPFYCRQHGVKLSLFPEGDSESWVDEFAAARPSDCDWVAIVSPSNPTGWWLDASAFERLLSALPDDVRILLDQVYADFGNGELTPLALRDDRVVVVRSFSKSHGLAGMRVGYALGSPEILAAMRDMASPYPVSTLSAHLALCMLRDPPPQTMAYHRWCREARDRIIRAIEDGGGRSSDSRGNFVFARLSDPEAIHRKLLARDVVVRRFEGQAAHEQAGLRITCPATPDDLFRLESSIVAALGGEL